MIYDATLSPSVTVYFDATRYLDMALPLQYHSITTPEIKVSTWDRLSRKEA